MTVPGLVAGLLPAEAAAQGLVLTSYHLVGDVDAVVGDVELLVDGNVELGGHAHLELEGVFRLVGVETVALVGQGVAENVEVVLLDIVEQGVANELVDLVIFHALAIFLLDEAGGHVTRTESGLGVLLADFLELFLYLVRVVALCNHHCDLAGDVAESCIINLHFFDMVLYFCLCG